MNRTRITIAAFAAAGLLHGAAASAADKPDASKQPAAQSDGAAAGGAASPSKDKQGGSANAPEGFVLIEERLVLLTANEPQNHFLRAAEYLAANSARQAAGEVRIAASYLDMQASRGKGAPQDLKGAAEDLRRVADQIQQQQKPGGQQAGKPDDKQPGQPQAGQQQAGESQEWTGRQLPAEQRQIAQAFARANLALARHFQALADQGVQKKRAVMAGHDLDAAASALRAAVVWSGQKPDQAAVQAVATARQVSAQLLAPTGAGQQQQQQQQSQQPQGDDAAQPAASKVGGSAQGAAQGGAIPADASKAIEQLGSAIEACNKQIGKAGDAGQAKPDAGKSETGKPDAGQKTQ